MKKNIVFGLLILTSVSINSFAQSAPATEPQKPAGKIMPMPRSGEQHPKADAATRTQKFTDRITKALNLDAATSKKVYDAYLVRTKKVDEIQANGADGKAQNPALKANKDNFEAVLKGILAPAQFDQYSKMEADKKDHHKDGDKPKS